MQVVYVWADKGHLQEVDGHWEGAINVMGQELMIKVDLRLITGFVRGH